MQKARSTYHDMWNIQAADFFLVLVEPHFELAINSTDGSGIGLFIAQII